MFLPVACHKCLYSGARRLSHFTQPKLRIHCIVKILVIYWNSSVISHQIPGSCCLPSSWSEAINIEFKASCVINGNTYASNLKIYIGYDHDLRKLAFHTKAVLSF